MSDNNYFSRENRLARRARRLAEFDSFSGISHKSKGKLTTQNAGQHAVQVARDLLNSFRMPSMPKLSYSGIRNAKTAQSSSKLEDGVITIYAEIRTISGVNIGFDIPMEIREGELMDPSVVVIDGAPRIIAQSTFDDLVERSTMYDLPPIREMYSAPVQQNQAAEAYGNRTKMQRVNTGMFSLGANRQALKNAVAGKSVNAQMEAAGPDEQAMNMRINDLSHKMDMGLGPKDQHMQELQKLVQQRENLRKQLQPGPKGPHEAGPPTSPLAPAQTPGSTYGHGGHQITQPVPKRKTDKYPGYGYSPHTDVTQVDDSMDPTKLEDTVVTPTSPGAPLKPETTKVSPPRGAAVEDYDAEDKWKKPDHDRNHQDDDWLDPAERYHQHDLHVGQEVTLKEALEVKERGGAVHDLPKGTKCKILRDHAGDNKSFVVRFEDDALEAIVERHFLAKSAAMIRTAAERADDQVLVNTGYIVDHPLADVPGVSLCGGAIRDFIRGRKPKDYDYFFDDIATHKACVDMFVKDGGVVIDGSEMATRILHNGDMYELVHGRIFNSLAETLDSFDITACMFGTKGREVWATQIGLDDLNAAVIRPWNIWHLPITHLRIAKLCDIHGFRDPFGVRDAVAKRAHELGFDLTAQVITPTPFEQSLGITAGSVIANRTASAVAQSMTPWQQRRVIEPSSAIHPMFIPGYPMPVLDPATGKLTWGSGPASCVAPQNPVSGTIHVQMVPGGPITCQYPGCTGSCINNTSPSHKRRQQQSLAQGYQSGVLVEPNDVIDMPQQTMGKAWTESQIIAKLREYKNSLKMQMDQAVQKVIQEGASGTPTPAPDEVKYMQSLYKSAQLEQAKGSIYVVVPAEGANPGDEMAVFAPSPKDAVMAVIGQNADWADIPDDWYNSDIPVKKVHMGGFAVCGPYSDSQSGPGAEILSTTAPPNSNADGAILPPEKGMPVEEHDAAPKQPPKSQMPTKIPKRKRSPHQKVKRQMNPQKHGDGDVTYHNMQERDMAGGLGDDNNFIAKVNEEVGGMRDQGLSDIDIKHAVFTKYGPEVAEKVFA